MYSIGDTLWQSTKVASVLIIVIVFLRFILIRKCSRSIALILWGVLWFKLIVPFQIPLYLNISPNINIAAHENTSLGQLLSPFSEPGSSLNQLENSAKVYVPMQSTYIGTIWLCGSVALFTIYIVLHVYNHRKFKTACILKGSPNVIAWKEQYNIPLHIPVFESNKTATPIVLGILKQKIILPIDIHVKSKSTTMNVLLHEYVHIQHRDNLLICIATSITILYWFNPLVWFSLFLFIQDIEYRCDEKVVEKIGVEQRQGYALSLLEMATPLRTSWFILNSSFKSHHFKNRVKQIMNYNAYNFRSMVIGILLITGVFFCTTVSFANKTEDPSSSDSANSLSTAHTESLIINDDKYTQPQDVNPYINSDYGVSTFVEPFTIMVEVYQEKISVSNPEVNLSPNNQAELNKIQTTIVKIIKQTVVQDDEEALIPQKIMTALQQHFKLANSEGFQIYISK